MSEIEKAAIRSIAVDKSKKLLSEIGELMVDDDIREEILEEFPILKYRGVYKSIRDAIFFRKFCKFLEGASNASIEDRGKYVEGMSDEEILKNGSYLINYIERLDEQVKPELAGKLFSEYIKGNITQDELLRYHHILDKIFVLDLIELKKSMEAGRIADNLAMRVAPLGITEYKIKDNPKMQEMIRSIGSVRPARAPIEKLDSKITTVISELGVQFLKATFT